jgi:PhnB protein
MAKAVKPIPEGFHSISPALTCREAHRAIEFYMKAFGAQELVRKASPDGKISHSELKIGDSVIFVGDEMAGMSSAPADTALPAMYLFLYVPDVDTVFNRAISAGARVAMPVQDMFWGDRYGKLADPFGHYWGIATHIEDVAPEEIDRRATAFFAKTAGKS